MTRQFVTFSPALIAFAAALLLPAATDAAQSVGSSSTYGRCLASARTTLAMERCQSSALDSENAAMAVVLAKTLSEEPADQAAKLRSAQRLWLQFRKSDCDVYWGAQTGTLAGVQTGSCLVQRTAQRVNDLGHFVEVH